MATRWLQLPPMGRPSFKAGFARSAAESEVPGQWRSLIGMWDTSLGHQGGQLYDLSGSGNHGVLTNMDPGTDWIAGPYGLVLDFDGTNDCIPLNPALFPSTYPMSYVAYFRATTNGTNRPIVVLEDTSNGDIRTMLYMNPSGNVFWNIRNLTEEVEIGGAGADDNAWHVVVGTSFSSTDHAIYLDGVSIATSSTSVTLVTYNTAAIGRQLEAGSADSFFTGQIAQVRLYKRGLLPAEVAAMSRDPFTWYHLRKRMVWVDMGGVTEETLDIGGTLGTAGALIRQPARTFAGAL